MSAKFKPTPEQMFALMDDAAQRMAESAVAMAQRCFTPEEHDTLVATFKQRNATLAQQIKTMDARIESEQQRIHIAHAEYCARIDHDHRAFNARMERIYDKWANVKRWTTWGAWAMFWVSGFAARGGLHNWLGGWW